MKRTEDSWHGIIITSLVKLKVTEYKFNINLTFLICFHYLLVM